MRKSKRLKKAEDLLLKYYKNNSNFLTLKESLEYLKEYKNFSAKFDETVEVAFSLGVDTKQTDQLVRGSVPMPFGLGKTVKIAVFTTPEKIKDALNAGANHAGYEDLMNDVKNNKIDFDVYLATPDAMLKLGQMQLGKVLGPRGLMPNPKLGTVSDNLSEMVKRIKAGQVEFKVEKSGIVHAGIGKLSFEPNAIEGNFVSLYSAVLAAKPQSSKGIYMQKAYISTSQGVGIQIDLSSISSSENMK